MTAPENKRLNWQFIVFAGLTDFVFGVGLLTAGLTGMLGETGLPFAALGGVMAVAGAGIAIWARNKLSQGSGPGGDQN